MGESDDEVADGRKERWWHGKGSTLISVVAVIVTILIFVDTRGRDWGALEQSVTSVEGRVGKVEERLEEVETQGEDIVGLEREVRFARELITRLEDEVEEVTKRMADVESDVEGRVRSELSELRLRIA